MPAFFSFFFNFIIVTKYPIRQEWRRPREGRNHYSVSIVNYSLWTWKTNLQSHLQSTALRLLFCFRYVYTRNTCRGLHFSDCKKKKKGIIEPKGRAWNEQASGEAIEYGGGGLSFPLWPWQGVLIQLNLALPTVRRYLPRNGNPYFWQMCDEDEDIS